MMDLPRPAAVCLRSLGAKFGSLQVVVTTASAWESTTLASTWKPPAWILHARVWTGISKPAIRNGHHRLVGISANERAVS